MGGEILINAKVFQATSAAVQLRTLVEACHVPENPRAKNVMQVHTILLPRDGCGCGKESHHQLWRKLEYKI